MILGIVFGLFVVKVCFVFKEDVVVLFEGDDLFCWIDEVELCEVELSNEICFVGIFYLVFLIE